MKKLIALFAVTLPLMGQAEVEPWRCKTEKSVGVDISEDLRPANWSNRPEYRIVPAEDVLSKFEGADAGYLRDLRDNFAAQAHKVSGHAFIRRVSDDPKSQWSWRACTVSHTDAHEEADTFEMGDLGKTLTYPSYSTYACANGDFRLNTLTKRFHKAVWGNWITLDEKSKSIFWENLTSDDYSFDFGTCEKYYD